MIVAQLSMTLPEFCRTVTFITMVTTACHWFLAWISCIHYKPSHLHATVVCLSIVLSASKVHWLSLLVPILEKEFSVYSWNMICPGNLILLYTGCPRRNVPDFGRVFLRSNYTDITQNTSIQSGTVTEIMAREFWNFDSYYSLIDYQIHIETGRNMWFL